MKKIEKLKIGNYILTFDNFFRKSKNYCGVDVCVDHCKGAKTFKNVEAYIRFWNYLNYNPKFYSINRNIIFYGDFVISLTLDSTSTIGYEMYNGRELSMRYDEITETFRNKLIGWYEKRGFNRPFLYKKFPPNIK